MCWGVAAVERRRRRLPALREPPRRATVHHEARDSRPVSLKPRPQPPGHEAGRALALRVRGVFLQGALQARRGGHEDHGAKGDDRGIGQIVIPIVNLVVVSV